MKLFGKNKLTKKVVSSEENENKECYVKVLGSGCKKCNTLSENAKTALKEMKMDSQIQKISDFVEIANFGVMSTPALVFGKSVISTGKVLSSEEIKELLLKEGV